MVMREMSLTVDWVLSARLGDGPLWSRRVMAVEAVVVVSGALFMAMSELCWPGCPPRGSARRARRLSLRALPCTVKIAPLAYEQVLALHALRGGGGSRPAARSWRRRTPRWVVGLLDAGQQGEGAVLELHGHALERVERRRDLEQLQDRTGWSPSIAPLAMRKRRL